jgi:hypothetical protein
MVKIWYKKGCTILWALSLNSNKRRRIASCAFVKDKREELTETRSGRQGFEGGGFSAVAMMKGKNLGPQSRKLKNTKKRMRFSEV